MLQHSNMTYHVIGIDEDGMIALASDGSDVNLYAPAACFADLGRLPIVGEWLPMEVEYDEDVTE